MAGLSGAVLLALCAAQQPGQDAALHAARAAELLAAPRPAEAGWRGMLHQSLARLDHADPALAGAGWELLDGSGRDADRANRILYLRRQGLPLPAPAVGEGVDSALERALAAWGAGRLEEAAERLRAALAQWPGDDRLAPNLAWLERRPPPALARGADARGCALAVLAARRAIP